MKLIMRRRRVSFGSEDRKIYENITDIQIFKLKIEKFQDIYLYMILKKIFQSKLSFQLTEHRTGRN